MFKKLFAALAGVLLFASCQDPVNMQVQQECNVFFEWIPSDETTFVNATGTVKCHYISGQTKVYTLEHALYNETYHTIGQLHDDAGMGYDYDYTEGSFNIGYESKVSGQAIWRVFDYNFKQ
jgi:hypothetical protein